MPSIRRLGILLLLAVSLHSWGAAAQGFAIPPELQAQLDQARTRQLRQTLFPNYLHQHPDWIWSSTLSTSTKAALADWVSSKTVTANEIYGRSVSRLDLRNKTAKEVETLLLARGFVKHDDFIRDPKSLAPATDASGNQVPMTVYTHPDGGMVRVKPKGDPTSRFRPQPDLVESVRYPFDADYRDFAREAFKVDSEGRAIPKAPSDLYNPYSSTDWKSLYVDSWADDAHVDLKSP